MLSKIEVTHIYSTITIGKKVRSFVGKKVRSIVGKKVFDIKAFVQN